MNSFIEIANNLANQWLNGMWAVVWQSAALAVIVYLLTLCVKQASAAVRFWLWMLVPLRLLVMPLITIALPLLPASAPVESTYVEPAPMVRVPAVNHSEMILPEPEPSTVAPRPAAMQIQSAEVTRSHVRPSGRAFLMALWLGGVGLYSVRLLLSLHRIRRIAAGATAAGDEKVLAMAQKAATALRLKRMPRILVTDQNISPFLSGVLRPVLVAPAGLIANVDTEALYAVFAHEFAHLRRRDPLIGWVLAICEAIYFFHPVLHLAKRRILSEREQACDNWVVAGSRAKRSTYANALICAAGACRGFSARIGPVGAVAESFGDLKKRLLAISRNLKPRARLSVSALILLVIVGAICVPGIVLTARTNGSKGTEPQDKVGQTKQLVAMTILPRDPIRSLEDYSFAYQVRALVEDKLNIESVEMEIRSTGNASRVARMPITVKHIDELRDKHRFPAGSKGRFELNRRRQRFIGRLPNGEYLVAVNVNGVRCSNVASFVIDSNFDAGSEPTLRVFPLPVEPGRNLPYLGIRALGPTPQDSQLKNDMIAFPDLVVDGIVRRPKSMKWVGPVGPLTPGQMHTRVLDLSNYEPEIEPRARHEVRAIVGKYESAPVVMPADDSLGRQWDKSTEKLPAIPLPGIALKGKVIGSDGRAAANYEVHLFGENGERFSESSGTDGEYEFFNVPSGEYQLVCNPRGRGQPGLTIEQVGVGANEPLVLNLSLKRQYNFAGKVHYKDGKPAGKMDIALTCEDPVNHVEFVDSTTTDANGRYELGGPFGSVSYIGVNGRRIQGPMPRLKPGLTELNYILGKNKRDRAVPIGQPGAKTDLQLDDKRQPRNSGKLSATESDAKVVKGFVRDRQGQPIPQARVILYYNHSRWGLGNRNVEEAYSAADGSFAFKRPLAYSPTARYPRGQGSHILLATHPDHALDWHTITRGQEQPSYELTLTEPKSQTITVTDHEGNPLAGARVWPYNIGSRTDPDPLFRNYLSLPTDAGVVGAATGADGKATITNLPRTSCSFNANLKGYAQGLSFSGSRPIRLSKGTTVSGAVLNEQGKPVEGAIVRFHTDWMWNFFLARTDSQGRFRIEDLPANGWDMSAWGNSEGGDGSYRITIEHSDYISPETQDQLQPGEAVEDFNIDAYRGTLIKCSVVDIDTNRPVAGARIGGSNESGRIDGRSDADGVFTVRVMSGPASLSFDSPPKGVYVLRGQNPPESRLRLEAKGKEMSVTLKTPPIAGPLTTVSGKVVLPDGTPAANVKISTTMSASYESLTFGGAGGARTATNVDGSFELTEVPAGLGLFLYGHTRDYRYVLQHVIDSVAEKTELAEPLVMQPGQLADVALSDEEGKPRANMSLKIKPVMWGNKIFRADFHHGKTDAEGRFKIDGVIPGMEYFIIESSANLGESGWWDRYYNEKIVLIPSAGDAGVTDSAGPSSRADEAANADPVKVSSSRAWYILRQWNTGPLLAGLTQRLGRVVASPRRDTATWTGVTGGGSLEIDIATEGDVTGEIFVGFFEDAKWSAEPVQVRSFPHPGRYTIGNLPAGKYQIGAMTGKLPVADALGVRRIWPEPVEIRPQVKARADVLVSDEFQKHASGWYNKAVSRDFLGDWERLDGENMLQGRVTGPGGRPVPFAMVQVREHKPGARSIAAPNCGTSEQGYYKCDRIAWPYRVGVLRREPIPSVLGYRHQYLSYNRVFEGSQTIDLQFEPFPGGDARLNGKVVDQNGDPLTEFHIDVSTKIDWEVMKNPDGEFYKTAGYHIPFVSADGTFELGGLPDADVRVRVIPFQIQAYSSHRAEELVLSTGRTSTIELKVTAKNVLFGRVLFKDGSPAVIKPPRWKGARTRVSARYEDMPWAGTSATIEADGYFAIHVDEQELAALRSGRAQLTVQVPDAEERHSSSAGIFPFERLSRDKSKAGVLKIEHPLGEPPSIVGRPIPKLEAIAAEFEPESTKGKKVLVCFWDMQQRPSRNLVAELARRQKVLENAGVAVLLAQTSQVDADALRQWLDTRKIPFTCGNITGDIDRVLFRWGVRAQPWLVLADEYGIIQVEGISVDQLDARLKE